MDTRSKFAGSTLEEVCPHCGKCKDSREHRVLFCEAFSDLCRHYQAVFDGAPRCALLFGLWPPPDRLLEWQASLDAIPLPRPVRTETEGKTCFFTDGSCLFPSVSDLRIAAAAVVTPSGSGTFSRVWSGLLPTSQQSIQRAELLAGSYATGSALHPVVIADSLYFIRTACRLREDWRYDRSPRLPADNADLWEFFWSCLSGCDSVEFVWVKAHQSKKDLAGLDRIMAEGNDAADCLAKQEVQSYQRSSRLYQTVVGSRLKQIRFRGLLDAFHLHLAYRAVGQDQAFASGHSSGPTFYHWSSLDCG